jgi:hypothetical protein
MAFLNKQERDQLENELKGMKFGKATGKLRSMDPNGRLVYYRNVQETGEWNTRYELKGLGARVTLVERQVEKAAKVLNFLKTDKLTYDLVDVRVEPTPDNRL